ncbi:MAG TPA: aminotransferase class IV [Anaerolineaceae bacterium]|nr:aminotransferase class IV [Anaerolineaceae bacterium]
MILAVKIPCNGPLFEPVSGLSDLSSLDQVSTELPRGVYTTFRTYLRSYAYDLEDHFQRLVNSASLVGNQITLDSGRIRAAIRQILPSLEGEEFRIRISIDLESESCTAFVLIDKLVQPLEEDYRNGIKTLTRIFHRENPEAKSTEFISKSKNFRRLISSEVNEVLLCEPAGEIMEGLSSNFFGVMENKIFTAGEGVLSGITRALVLEEAGNYHIEVVYRPINLNEISRLSEAFLTSTSRAVLPVRQIDECMIGSGSPGSVSEILARAYLERVKRGLEEI